MEFLPTAFVLLPMGMLFFTSGLIVNLIQALCYCTLRPFSKNSYRKVNKVVVELLWLELIWLFEWWGGIKIELFTELETLQVMGKEHALVISNHRSDVDWLLGWVLAQHSGCLGSALGVMKRSLKFLPVLGWSMWFSEYVYLERSWAKDETNLKSSLRRLNDFPLPFWLALFVEGTRFTKAKLLIAQEYAASTGLPLPRNVLIPRTKGFVASVSSLRSFVPAIYDVTVAVPKDEPPPTMLRIFKRKSSVLHVRLKRHLMTELPANDDEISQWCKDIFVSKDNLLDKHLADNTFGEDLYQPMELSLKPPLLIFGWCMLLVFPAFKVLSFLLSTWQGFLCLTVSILSTSVLMQVFIRFSQSEHSTPGQAAPVKSTTRTSKKTASKGNKNI